MANYIYPNVSKYWITIASSLDGLDVLNRTRIEFISLGVPWPSSSSTTLRTEWTVSNVTRPDRLLLVKGGIQRSCVSLCALWGSGLSSLNNQTRSHCPLFFILGRLSCVAWKDFCWRCTWPGVVRRDQARKTDWPAYTHPNPIPKMSIPRRPAYTRCQWCVFIWIERVGGRWRMEMQNGSVSFYLANNLWTHFPAQRRTHVDPYQSRLTNKTNSLNGILPSPSPSHAQKPTTTPEPEYDNATRTKAPQRWCRFVGNCLHWMMMRRPGLPKNIHRSLLYYISG